MANSPSDPALAERDLALWFTPFIKAHLQRFPRSDWPMEAGPRKEFFASWKSGLGKARATGPLADQASQRLAEDPPRHLSDHLPALLRIVGELRQQADRAQGRHSDRLSAEEASRGCPHCAGQGLASVERRDLGRHVAAYCVCPAGTWMREKHEKSARDVKARILNLADIPGLVEGTDERIMAAWDQAHESTQADHINMVRRTHPAIARNADQFGPDSHWARWILSLARCAHWDTSNDVERVVPKILHFSFADPKPEPSIGVRVEEIDAARLAEQERKRAEFDAWVVDRIPRWKQAEIEAQTATEDPEDPEEQAPWQEPSESFDSS